MGLATAQREKKIKGPSFVKEISAPTAVWEVEDITTVKPFCIMVLLISSPKRRKILLFQAKKSKKRVSMGAHPMGDHSALFRI